MPFVYTQSLTTEIKMAGRRVDKKDEIQAIRVCALIQCWNVKKAHFFQDRIGSNSVCFLQRNVNFADILYSVWVIIWLALLVCNNRRMSFLIKGCFEHKVEYFPNSIFNWLQNNTFLSISFILFSLKYKNQAILKKFTGMHYWQDTLWIQYFIIDTSDKKKHCFRTKVPQKGDLIWKYMC